MTTAHGGLVSVNKPDVEPCWYCGTLPEVINGLAFSVCNKSCGAVCMSPIRLKNWNTHHRLITTELQKAFEAGRMYVKTESGGAYCYEDFDDWYDWKKQRGRNEHQGD